MTSDVYYIFNEIEFILDKSGKAWEDITGNKEPFITFAYGSYRDPISLLSIAAEDMRKHIQGEKEAGRNKVIFRQLPTLAMTDNIYEVQTRFVCVGSE